MRRNKFDKVMRDLNLADDTNLSMDGYCEARPHFGVLNGAFKQANISENLSIDGTMKPRYPISYPRAKDQELLIRFGNATSVCKCIYIEQDGIRFDQTSHWPERNEKRYTRCKFCGGRTVYVALHPDNIRSHAIC